jgi:TonB-dependent receptor
MNYSPEIFISVTLILDGEHTMLRKILFLSLFFGTVFGSPYSYAAAGTAGISGIIRDAQTSELLPGANVALVGTGFGSGTDIYGKYAIKNVPAGTYTLRVTYIGYKLVETKVTVAEGAEVKHDFKLDAVSLEGETVVITAQAQGQNEAINKKLSSMTIMDVVSADHIQELPDANAAESVGRLPGVSLLRNGGEGAQVVIRGLAPKYNEIMVDGVKLASSNSGDRSTDLSMISPEMLNGIEVSKTASADQDADVLGGSVNFTLREAQTSEEESSFRLSLLTQGSYVGLSDAYHKYNNYKYVVGVENRFFENQFGVFLQASMERRNLSSNELGASYLPFSGSFTDYLVQTIRVNDIYRDRLRKNAVLGLDYLIPAGRITFSNFLSTGTTETENRQELYTVGNASNQSFIPSYSKSTLNMITNIFKYDQQISFLHTVVTASHSYSETKDPNDWTFTFMNSNANLRQFFNQANLDPQTVARAANDSLANTSLYTLSSNNSFTRERNVTVAADFDIHYNISDAITSIFKFGGKMRQTTRSYNLDAIDGEAFLYASGTANINQLKSAFPWFQSAQGNPTTAPMSIFLDPNFNYGKFLGGDYTMVYPQDMSKLKAVVEFLNAHQLPQNVNYNYDIGNSTRSDYTGKEVITAGYAMATFNVENSLTITPGVRFQQLKSEYTAAQGLQGPNPSNGYNNREVTVTAYHPYWLPSVLVKYKPVDWFDIRLAYSNTISYPDFASLAPIITVTQSAGTLQWNGFNLDPIRSKNFDAYLSLYDNSIGLFTVGGFLKQITDLIYPYQFTPSSPAQLGKYYPAWADKPTTSGLLVTEYLNNPYKINDYGIELDWQTHFWYLPQPFSGIVANVNYTHIFSKAKYPVSFNYTRPNRSVDSSYTAPLLYQPDNILNFSVGYDYKAFSIRVSSIYSDKIFTGPNFWPQLRSYTSASQRWDLAVKQGLPIEGLQIFYNWNNFSNANDLSVIAAPTGVPSQQQNYSYTMELGLRYQL